MTTPALNCVTWLIGAPLIVIAQVQAALWIWEALL